MPERYFVWTTSREDEFSDEKHDNVIYCGTETEIRQKYRDHLNGRSVEDKIDILEESLNIEDILDLYPFTGILMGGYPGHWMEVKGFVDRGTS